MSAPSKEHYIATVFELLDELDWAPIRWADEDFEDFTRLLGMAWDRASNDMTDEEFEERAREIADYYAAHMPKDDGDPVG